MPSIAGAPICTVPDGVLDWIWPAMPIARLIGIAKPLPPGVPNR